MSNLASRREWRGEAAQNDALGPIGQVYTWQTGTGDFAGMADHTIKFTEDPKTNDYKMEFLDSSNNVRVTSKSHSLKHLTDGDVKIARVCAIAMNKDGTDRDGCCVTVAMIDLGPGATPRYKLSGVVRGYNSSHQHVLDWLPRWFLKLFYKPIENPLSGTWTATSG